MRGLKQLLAAFKQTLTLLGGKTTPAQAALQHMVSLAERQWRERGPAPTSASGTLVSFVTPVFNAPPSHLDDLLASFRQQVDAGVACELILSDDGSSSHDTLKWLASAANLDHVVVVGAQTNGGIARATNAGLRAARGHWVAFVDHDDRLTPYAADVIARALHRHPECELFYTDEVITNGALRPLDIFYKPAWDPVLLSGVNYINHLSVYRRERLMSLGGLREGFEGSQDYDLVLRYTQDLAPEQIKHVPYPAYQWRRTGQTFSAKELDRATGNARRALAERFSSPGTNTPVSGALTPDLHRVRFDQSTQDWPLVSIIVPTKDQYELISQLLAGLKQTDYPNYEVILVDNGSTDSRVLALYETLKLQDPSLRVLLRREPFNFSRSINRGVEVARGDAVLFLNNDIEILEPTWLKEMVSCLQYGGVGIVGARLLYPDRSLQHAGVIVGFGGLAGHWYIGQAKDFPGPQGRLRVRNSYSAVTGACLLATRSCLVATGPLDEHDFAIAYNDVDFCMRARGLGFRVVWTPFATLIHHESASRGSDETPENLDRFNLEKQNLAKRHATGGYMDPAVSPWMSRDRAYPEPVKLQDLPEAR